MKILFFLIVVSLFTVIPVYAQFLSDATGLVNKLDIQTSGHYFEIDTVSNFAISDFEFDKDEKKLTLFISSGAKNNLSDISIPRNLLDGNMTFYLNDEKYYPEIKTNERISFVTLNFTGSGDHTLEIFGTTYLSGLEEIIEKDISSNTISSKSYEYGTIFTPIILIILVIAGVVGIVVFIVKKRK